MSPDINSPSPSPGSHLEMYVLGAGKGESIILRLPDCPDGKARWGVVDCYARDLKDPRSNPTLNFLNQAGVTELEFLCLTHPHDDHYRGMSHLLEHLTVHRFWQFNFPYTLIAQFVTMLIQTARGSEEGEERSSAQDLRKTLALVKQKQIPRAYLMANQPLYPSPRAQTKDLSIQALGPSAESVDGFARAIERWCSQRQKQQNPPRVNANSLSGTLLIKYGKTQVVLGGDAEKSNWQATLDLFQASDLEAHIVKVSHHGSDNGYCSALWKTFCPQEREAPTYAVIAPYRAQDLPNKKAVAHILSHTPHVWTTCPPEVPFEAWEDTPRGVTCSWNRDRPSGPVALQQLPFLGFEPQKESREDPLGIVSLAFDAAGNVYGPKALGPAGPLLPV